MTEDDLIKWRQIIHDVLISELTVRNTVLLETLRIRLSGNAGASMQDGIQATLSLLDEINLRNRKFYQGHLEAQMLADEMTEAIQALQQLAKDNSVK